MSKALKSWSGMRKYLEKEMLADSIGDGPEWLRRIYELRM